MDFMQIYRILDSSKRFHYDWALAWWQLNKIGENSWKQFKAVQKWFIASENDIKPLQTAKTT